MTPPSPSHLTARRARLAAWVAVLLLLVPGQLAWLLLTSRATSATAPLLLGAAAVAAVAMLALLRTTPRDAIRLTPRTSAAVVIGGTSILQAAALAASRDAGPPLASRAALALLTVAAVAVLVIAFRRSGESVWHAALFGWNPLLTLTLAAATAPAAHVVGLAFVAATLAAAAVRRFKLAAVALALAARVEPLTALLLPFLWRRTHEERSFRAGRRVVLVFAIGSLVAWVMPMHPRARAVSPASTLERAPVPGFVYDLASLVARADHAAASRPPAPAGDVGSHLLALPALLGMALLLWQSRATLAEAGYWLTMVMLLFAPAVHPWQVLWPVVFVPMLRGPQGFAALVWAAAVTLGQSGAPVGGRGILQYLPVLAVLVVEICRLAGVVPLGRIVQGPQSPNPTPSAEH